MTKKELIELLKDYKENKARLNIKIKELKNARYKLEKLKSSNTDIGATSYGLNSDIHSKNTISDNTSKKIIRNEQEKEKTEAEIKELEKEVKKLRQAVDEVDDRLQSLKYKEREILTAYYVEGRTAEDIGNKLYFSLFSQTRSERHIRRIIEDATENMLKL